MDFQRLFLFLIFSFSVFLLWDSWERAQHPVAPQVSAASPASAPVAASAKDESRPSTVDQLASVQAPVKSGKKIHVTTDFLSVEINTMGANLQHLELLKHRATEGDKPFVLLEKHDTHTYFAQSGLLGDGLPTHTAEFTSSADNFELQDGKDTLEVKFLATTPTGVKVAKIYTFHRASYVIDVGYEIENSGKTALAPSAYFQLVRDSSASQGDSKFVPTYTGPAVYTEETKFKKVSFSDIEKNKADYPKTATNGWMAMLQHYFVAAWLPKDKAEREYFTRHLDGNLYAAGVILTVPSIAPGKSGDVSVSLYAGPAESSLDKVAPGLGLTVDYGLLTAIAKPLFWLLSLLHGVVHNWGLAIILLTVLIKLAFFPLSATSYRSMAKMRVVAPKLEKIKQQYADDRERLHKAMMELYKTEKINPLGGCLPVIIQIPVFISLYWAILSSVELRHAPFIGWITDLSSPDRFYVLPLIMGASMLLQGRLNPKPPDPLQAKVMQMMPVIFSVVFFFFPAGLVLYSVVNNALSIAQQWYITRGAVKNAS